MSIYYLAFDAFTVWQAQAVQGNTTGIAGTRVVSVPVSTVRPTASSLVAGGATNIRIARRPVAPGGTTTVLMPIQRQGTPGTITVTGQISSPSTITSSPTLIPINQQQQQQQPQTQQIVVTTVESLTPQAINDANVINTGNPLPTAPVVAPSVEQSQPPVSQ